MMRALADGEQRWTEGGSPVRGVGHGVVIAPVDTELHFRTRIPTAVGQFASPPRASRRETSPVTSTWNDPAKVADYVGRVGRIEARQQGEAELVEYLPAAPRHLLDIGCGDGRLIELVLAARPGVARAVGIDISPPMLRRAARTFADETRVEIVARDLRDPLPPLDPFDVVVSGFAIHHLEDDRKRSLLAEIAGLLTPGGVFANLEVVQCASAALQDAFNERIGRPGGDPEDRLASVEAQLGWMREAGLRDVDCAWRWRGFALLIGHTRHDGESTAPAARLPESTAG